MNAEAELPVGPELNAAVARALGWTLEADWDGWGQPPADWPSLACNAWHSVCCRVPLFSRCPANAWVVVEYLRLRGWSVTVHADAMPLPYLVELEAPDGLFHCQRGGDTMPEAVCRVVLLAGDALQGEQR